MNTLNSSTICAIIIVAASVIVIALVITAIVLILKSPFRYPYFRSYFNVSGKRNPKIDVFIDEYLNLGHFSTIKAHHKDILLWKQKCQERIQKSKMKNYREKQFHSCLDDENAFRFYLIREQTRYRQRNYVKIGRAHV